MIGRFHRKSWLPAWRPLRPDAGRTSREYNDACGRFARLYPAPAEQCLRASASGHRHAFCRLRRSTRSWAGRPRTITRDAQGHPTLRALRVGEAIAVDGRLSERFYNDVAV